MTEALKAVIRVGFEQLGLHRIDSYHAPDNAASGRVMQRAGMTYEGRLRDYEKLPNGTFVDSNVYSILKTDYDH